MYMTIKTYATDVVVSATSQVAAPQAGHLVVGAVFCATNQPADTMPGKRHTVAIVWPTAMQHLSKYWL